MKTYTTPRAKAQQAVEDAIAERNGYEPQSEIIAVTGPEDQQIDCTLRDIEEFAEDEACLDADSLIDGTPDAETFVEFRDWVKAAIADAAEDAPPPDPDVKYWAITGRLPGEDEDSGGTYGPCTEAEAEDAFTAEQQDGEDLEGIKAQYGDTIFINCKFSSATPIE